MSLRLDKRADDSDEALHHENVPRCSSLSSSTVFDPSCVVFWMHGLGQRESKWNWLMRESAERCGRSKMLRRFNNSSDNYKIEWVFPQANAAPVAVFGGRSVPTWMDLSPHQLPMGDDHDVGPCGDKDRYCSGVYMSNEISRNFEAWTYSSARDVLEADARLRQNIVRVHGRLAALRRPYIVGGFSQGGSLALLLPYLLPILGLQMPPGCLGVVCCSGWFLLRPEPSPRPAHSLHKGDDEFETEKRNAAKSYSNSTTSLPLLWIHGARDKRVPLNIQMTGCATLRQSGVGVIKEGEQYRHKNITNEDQETLHFFPIEAFVDPEGKHELTRKGAAHMLDWIGCRLQGTNHAN